MPLAPFTYRVARWHLRRLAGRYPGPLGCGYYITSKCNFKCEFCNIWRIRPATHIPETDARNLVEQLGRMGLIYFSISGGEPLLVPYIHDLLAHAKESGILYTHVVSNGWLVDKERARALAGSKVSEISFSLDGGEEKHDTGRAQPGAYQRVLGAVEAMRAHAPGVDIILNTILDPKAPGECLAAVGIARELGVPIKVQPTNDHPLFKPDNPAQRADRILDDGETAELVRIIDLLVKTPHVVSSAAFLKNYVDFLLAPERMLLADEACIFGQHHLEFFENRLFPCLEGLDWKGGFDAQAEPLESLLTGPAYQQCLKDLEGCRGCFKNYYVCYYEPRLNFPIQNYLRSRLRRQESPS